MGVEQNHGITAETVVGDGLLLDLLGAFWPIGPDFEAMAKGDIPKIPIVVNTRQPNAFGRRSRHWGCLKVWGVQSQNMGFLLT